MSEFEDRSLAPADVRRVLEAFLSLNTVGSAGAVCVFLAIGESGGELDVNALAEVAGMPVVSVCRFAESLTKDDPRPGRRIRALVSRTQAGPGKLPRFALTAEGSVLFEGLFPRGAESLLRAA